MFWWLMLFCTHVLLLMKPPVLWLSIATFNNDTKPPRKWILSEFDVFRIWPRLGGLPPPWNVYMAKSDPGWEGYLVWQTGLLAYAGHPTYHANVIQVKWEIIWTGGLPHLSGLPHLPGVPLLHINRPLEIYLRLNVTTYNIITALFIFFI